MITGIVDGGMFPVSSGWVRGGIKEYASLSSLSLSGNGVSRARFSPSSASSEISMVSIVKPGSISTSLLFVMPVRTGEDGGVFFLLFLDATSVQPELSSSGSMSVSSIGVSKNFFSSNSISVARRKSGSLACKNGRAVMFAL